MQTKHSTRLPTYPAQFYIKPKLPTSFSEFFQHSTLLSAQLYIQGWWLRPSMHWKQHVKVQVAYLQSFVPADGPISLILQQGVQGKNVFKLSKVPQNQLLNWLGMLTQCNIIRTLVLLLTTWNRFVVLDIGQSMSDRWKTFVITWKTLPCERAHDLIRFVMWKQI